MYYHQIRSVIKYSEICHIICTIHNRSISVRQSKHLCQKLKLTRRYHVQDDFISNSICSAIDLASCTMKGFSPYKPKESKKNISFWFNIQYTPPVNTWFFTAVRVCYFKGYFPLSDIIEA